MSKAPTSKWLNPRELEKFKNYLVFAQTLVEGTYIGKHRSPREGKSVEFADYRPYVQGEDAGNVDWRVFARNKQLVCRRHHEETDMSVHILIDSSASMKFSSESNRKKFDIAARIGAALAYLIVHQGDKVSWTQFANQLIEHVPAGGTRRHLFKVIKCLEESKIQGHTNLEKTLGEARGLFRHRGKLVVLSDFWCDMESLFTTLHWYIHRGFEVMLLKIEDPWERSFIEGRQVRLVDLETRGVIELDASEYRDLYQKEYSNQVDLWQQKARSGGIQTAVVSTENPYLEAIEAYLGWKNR